MSGQVSEVLHDDEFCTVRRDSVEIKWYYFPLGASKSIDFEDITKISLYRGFSGRVWGSGDFKHWMACDSTRFGTFTPPKGIVFIEIKDCYWVAGFSCSNAEKVISLIRRRRPGIVREDVVRSGLSLVPAAAPSSPPPVRLPAASSASSGQQRHPSE